ncbi:hypothetical protein, partial [Streptomyces sp. NPDC056165]|uniref:hypothetical protein n=1 Tax=Streptomyces sp. NPDC056165 TaxID=3345733 RepID=UPI0035DEEF7C
MTSLLLKVLAERTDAIEGKIERAEEAQLEAEAPGLGSRWAAEDIEAVAATLNSRPRKSLGWKTPAEAL